MKLEKIAGTLCVLLLVTIANAGEGAGRSASQEASVVVLVNRAEQQLTGWRGNREVLETAKAYLDRAIKTSPNYPPAYKELARYYIMSGYVNSSSPHTPGSLESAEASLKKAILIDPNYVGAYVLFGHLYRTMHRPIEAKAALSKADGLGTTDPWLQLNWADILLDENKKDEAAKRYWKVVDSKTENKKAMGSAFEGLIRYNIAKGDTVETDRLYKKQIGYEPTNAWAYGNYAGFLLCNKDDFSGAIVQGKKAISIMDYGMGHYILGLALYRKWAQLVLDGSPKQQIKKSWDDAFRIYPDIEAVLASTEQCPPMKKFEKARLVVQAK